MGWGVGLIAAECPNCGIESQGDVEVCVNCRKPIREDNGFRSYDQEVSSWSTYHGDSFLNHGVRRGFRSGQAIFRRS